MRYIALLLLAAILSVVAGVRCSPKTVDPGAGVTAAITVDFAYDALSAAYALESAKVEREDCRAYGCESVYDCPSLSECPAQRELAKRWDPVWNAYELLATAVELKDSDAAREGYCKLRVTASGMGVALPVPLYACAPESTQ